MRPHVLRPAPRQCAKVTYRSEAAARVWMDRYNRADAGLTGAYRCPKCHAWHLTSRE